MASIQATFWTFAKRENSTKAPTDGGTTLNIVLKDATDLLNPVIELHLAEAFRYNYCYIDFTGRYYFIKSFDSIAKDTYTANLECDVLASWISEVRGQNVYASMSSYGYDELLDDGRIYSMPPTKAQDIKYAEDFTILQANQPTVETVYQFMSCTTKDGVLNGLDVFFGLGNSLVNNFLKACADENWLQQVTNYLAGNSPLNYVNEVWWSPLIPQQCHSVVERHDAHIFDIYLSGDVIASPTVRKHHTTIEVPKPEFTDFRYSERFVSYYLQIPYMGVKQIPTELLRDRSAIEVSYAGDCLTGQMAISPRVNKINLGMFGTSLKAPLSLSRQVTQVAQMIKQGGIGAGLGAGLYKMIGANPLMGALTLGTAAAFTRGIGDVPALDDVGSTIGSIAPLGCSQTAGNLALVMIEHDSNINPASLAAIAGRPTEKVVTIQNGYIQTRGASVAFGGSPEEIRQFNSLLNGGIYVE